MQHSFLFLGDPPLVFSTSKTASLIPRNNDLYFIISFYIFLQNIYTFLGNYQARVIKNTRGTHST